MNYLKAITMNRLHPWKLAIALTAGLVILAPHRQAQAQSANTSQTNPLVDFQNPNGAADPFNSRGTDSNSNLLQLMQRLQQQGTSPADFRAGQQESLNDAAAAFRAKQQARLKQMGAPVAPAVLPAVLPTDQTSPLVPLVPMKP
jgi:hypothetical protein